MSDIIRRLSCNQPKKDESAGKKFVVKACANGKERIVRFGDATMAHYKEGYNAGEGHNDEQRRRGFKQRHKCDQKKDKLTAGYWSCNWSW